MAKRNKGTKKQADLTPPQTREVRGSGSDKNSDTRRLANPDNLQDKREEDTFPASDPPSTSPLIGFGRRAEPFLGEDLPSDFKENPRAQFEYGRRSQASTLHFDRSTRRLELGNPNVGDVDLGTIEADKPAQPDDNDHWDSADDDDQVQSDLDYP